LQSTLDFYREKLGFTDAWRFGAKDGGIRRDDLRLLFEEDTDFTDDVNNNRHRLPLMWFVENIDAIYEELKASKIPLADELRAHPYGLKEFAFIDINGYYIRVAEETDEE
jgi:hypothetical protein